MTVHLVKEGANGSIVTFCGMRGQEYLTKEVYAERNGNCFVAVQPTDTHKGTNCVRCKRVTYVMKSKASKLKI